MKRIPIILEQFECVACKKKWYVNIDDKVENEMTCPYECECKGNLIRRFDMEICDYSDYVVEDKNKSKGGEE